MSVKNFYADENWVIPSGVTSIAIAADGGAGGDNDDGGGDCDPGDGGPGGNTTITYDGSLILTAAGGSNGYPGAHETLNQNVVAGKTLAVVIGAGGYAGSDCVSGGANGQVVVTYTVEGSTTVTNDRSAKITGKTSTSDHRHAKIKGKLSASILGADGVAFFDSDTYPGFRDTSIGQLNTTDSSSLMGRTFPSLAVTDEDKAYTAVISDDSIYSHDRGIDIFQTPGYADALLDSVYDNTPVTLASGVQCRPQLVALNEGPYTASAIYLFYTLANVLYFKPGIEAESAETLVSDLKSYLSYRAVVTRNNKLVVFYRDAANATTLYYRVRSAGIWGSETVFCTDIHSGSNIYFSAITDAGKNESVIVPYYDGTNLVYRTLTEGSISGKTTLVSAPSLTSQGIYVDHYASNSVLVSYWTSASPSTVTITLTPDTISVSSGTLIAKDGHPLQGTYAINTQMVSYGDKSLVVYTDKGGTGKGRIYNHVTPGWEGSGFVSMTPGYTDTHNTITLFLDADGYAYLASGGRSGTTMIVKKSTYAINHASFNPSTSWTDVTPPGSYSDLPHSSRGYKYIVLDQAGVIYLVFLQHLTSTSAVYIMEYRSDTWSTPVIIYETEFTEYVVHRPYVHDVKIGKETSGQKTIHLFVSYTDDNALPASVGGSSIQVDLVWLHILPNGNNTFTQIHGSGFASAETGVSAPTLWGCMEIIGTATPLMLWTVKEATTWDIIAIKSATYNGTSWDYATVDDTSAFPTFVDPQVVLSGSTVFVAGLCEVNGIAEVVIYVSTNYGYTWSFFRYLTSSSTSPNYQPLLSYRSDTAQNIIWQVTPHRGYSQVMFDSVLVSDVQESSSDRSSKITGGLESHRSAKITGSVVDFSDGRLAEIIAKDFYETDRSAKIAGVDLYSSDRLAKLTGKDSTSSNRSAKIVGADFSSNYRASKLIGKDSTLSNRPAKIIGRDLFSSNRTAKITGKIVSPDDRAAKVICEGTLSSDDRASKITGADFFSNYRASKLIGKDSTLSNRPAKIIGRDLSSSNRTAKIIGKIVLSDDRAAKVICEGTLSSDDRASKIIGIGKTYRVMLASITMRQSDILFTLKQPDTTFTLRQPDCKFTLTGGND